MVGTRLVLTEKPGPSFPRLCVNGPPVSKWAHFSVFCYSTVACDLWSVVCCLLWGGDGLSFTLKEEPAVLVSEQQTWEGFWNEVGRHHLPLLLARGCGT